MCNNEVGTVARQDTLMGDLLVVEIERWCVRRDMTESRFGREALGDPNFVYQLRSGRSPTGRTVARVRQFMSRGDV